MEAEELTLSSAILLLLAGLVFAPITLPLMLPFWVRDAIRAKSAR